jgi:hypothetical protein
LDARPVYAQEEFLGQILGLLPMAHEVFQQADQ